MTPSLIWSLRKEITLKKTKQYGKLLANSPASLKQKIKILNTIIKPQIAYAYHAVLFPKLDIEKLDKLINTIIKETCNIPKSTANILTHLPHGKFGINVTSLLPDYIHCIGQQLLQVINEPCQLGTIYQGLTKYITTNYGGSLHVPIWASPGPKRPPSPVMQSSLALNLIDSQLIRLVSTFVNFSFNLTFNPP